MCVLHMNVYIYMVDTWICGHLMISHMNSASHQAPNQGVAASWRC